MGIFSLYNFLNLENWSINVHDPSILNYFYLFSLLFCLFFVANVSLLFGTVCTQENKEII